MVMAERPLGDRESPDNLLLKTANPVVLALSEAMRVKHGDGKPGGILIDNVFDPSPASRLGIRVNDVLKSMEGERINNVHDFQRLLYHHGPGSRVRLGLVRDKKPLELTATIERRPTEATTR